MITSPELMRCGGIDMWVLVAREFNENSLLLAVLPDTWQSSRRTTILVFFVDGENVELLAVARYNIGFFETQWNRTIRIIMLEEDVLFNRNSVCYIDGRMKEFYLIPG